MFNIVGDITFENRRLYIYGDLDEPWFKAKDVAEFIDYSSGRTKELLEWVEECDKIGVDPRTIGVNPTVGRGRYGHIWFINEFGLHNVLFHSYKPIARKWNRIVQEELINMRRANGRNFKQQVEEWDDRANDIWFNEETGEIEYGSPI